MELNRDLKCLIERAWALHGKLNCEIEQSIKFCRFCSEHGRFCDVADQTPFEKRERLIVIRDSLKQVENILLLLQNLKSWQQRERHEALTSLEQSRLVLIDLVKRYQGKAPDVLRELNACFGNENCDIIQNVKAGLKKVDDPKLQNKWWKWPKAFGIALKFLMFSATISYMARLNHSRHLYTSSRRKVPSFLDSTEAEMRDNLLTISRSPPNVFHGRG